MPSPHAATAVQMTPNLLWSPASAASAAATASSPAAPEQEAPDRQPGCGEHWRRALGNITNRRRPRGKRRDKQQSALAQPQFTEHHLGPQQQDPKQHIEHSALPAHPKQAPLQAQRSHGDRHSAAREDEQPTQHAPVPEPEQGRAATSMRPLQPLEWCQDDMTTPGKAVQALLA